MGLVGSGGVPPTPLQYNKVRRFSFLQCTYVHIQNNSEKEEEKKGFFSLKGTVSRELFSN